MWIRKCFPETVINSIIKDESKFMTFSADHFLKKAACNIHTGVKQTTNHWTLSETWVRDAQWNKQGTFSQCSYKVIRQTTQPVSSFHMLTWRQQLRGKKNFIAYCGPQCSDTHGGIWGMGRQDKAAPGRHWSELTSRSEMRREDYRDCLGWMGLDSGSLEWDWKLK